jgi:hypothetical protein
MNTCLYFGSCYHRGGVGLVQSALDGIHTFDHRAETYGDHIHIDATLAPRLTRDGTLIWTGSEPDFTRRRRLHYETEECPQGQFLRHVLDSGYTAISWWDRAQYDKRGAINSTILLEGEHTSEQVLAAGRERYREVFENLQRAGIELVEVYL